MKYWYDTEFIEDGSTIDLISIGMVAEDGREFYVISTEFDATKASKWVRDNVLVHLPPFYRTDTHDGTTKTNAAFFYYRTRAEIKKELLKFIGNDKPELWAYYADYDHVALCQLFGTMMDLPEGWPMYTCDIKQLCDSLGNVELPKQKEGQHNALADARHNRVMYEYLLKIQCC
jgi:hypothetical protein